MKSWAFNPDSSRSLESDRTLKPEASSRFSWRETSCDRPVATASVFRLGFLAGLTALFLAALTPWPVRAGVMLIGSDSVLKVQQQGVRLGRSWHAGDV